MRTDAGNLTFVCERAHALEASSRTHRQFSTFWQVLSVSNPRETTVTKISVLCTKQIQQSQSEDFEPTMHRTDKE